MNEDEKSALNFPFERNSPTSAESVRQQLRRITDHPSFRATAAQKAFLQFVVDKVLAGESDQIKGYTIATQVFGRREDFDQATDPVVSIHANKLRRALEHYYLVEGKTDPIRIDIPKGTYVPVFHQQCDVESIPGAREFRFVEAALEGAWPTVLVRPFENLTGDPELNYLAIGLTTELAMEITRYQDIRVLMFDSQKPGRRAADSGARFMIEGNVRRDPAGIKVAVHLIDARTGTRIWADMHRSDLEAARMFAFQEQVARVVTAKIAGESGIIVKTLSMESKNLPPSNLQTYQAILRYYDFNAHYSADTFLNAFEALKLAVTKEPQCGLAWSLLGRLYAINHTLELFDQETPLKEAAAFAEKGVRLEPANQRARIISAFVKLLNGDIAAGLSETNRALALNPNSLIMLENIGYLMTLCGDWKRGPALIRKAIQLNPYYNVVVHYPLWVDWVRREEYENAYLETLNFRTPLLFWDPLMKAAALGLLGRIEEGKSAVEDLLRLKPDFAAGGRGLIRYYIKFDEIVDRTLAGLNAVGLNIE
jgi:TolB-like protein